jgi:hypothetical protein
MQATTMVEKIQPPSMMEVRFEWPISDNNHRQLQQYEQLLSSPFHLCGDNLQLCLYESDKYFSIELVKADPSQQKVVEVDVDALASLQTNESRMSLLRGYWSVTYTYPHNSIATTTSFESLSKTQSMDLGYGPPTGFTLLSKFTVEDARMTRNPAQVNTEKIGGLIKRGELTDVVLVASDGRELATHRAILVAHSQVHLQ